MDQVLIAENITKQFGKILAVDDISLRINKGEIVALLGPNGAGKTTTIRCLSSLSRPNEIATIVIDGVDLLKHPRRARKKIGVCAQEQNLYEDSTGQENMELQAYFYGIPKKITKERISELLQLVNLNNRRNDLVKKYSGGMKRRLQIARALVARPKLLFLDEPTLGLSPQSRKEVWNYILHLRKQGISILFTTHYMEEANSLADRVLIMNKGKIVAKGTPDQLKERYIGKSQVLIRSPQPSEVMMRLEPQDFLYKLQDDGIIQVKSVNGLFSQLLKSLEGLEINELSLKKPTLEDVFLEITGSALIEKTVTA